MERKRICQLTSAHSLDDERILHRFAVSAARMGYESCVVGPSSNNEEVRDGVSLIPCPRIKGNLTWTKRILALFSIYRWALKNKADIYQIHDPDLLIVGLILRISGRTIIYDVHDDYEESIRTRFERVPLIVSWLPWLWWKFESMVSRSFQAIFVADRHLKEKFNSQSPLVLGNYPFLDFTLPSIGSKPPVFRIIYVGGVTEVRGLRVFAEAMSQVENENLVVDIIGPCSDKELIETFEKDPRIILHGKKDWRELSDFYRRADLGIALYQPIPAFTYSPGENSVKIIEYMAAGIPVLTSNFKGLNRFVEGQDVGVTIDPTDSKKISEKLKFLISNRERLLEMGRKGRILFEDIYNWNVHEVSLEEVYINVLNRKSKR